jgi:hypothetical protein
MPRLCYFPKLDADIYVPDLLEGPLGARKWMSCRLGLIGDLKSQEKASRANGRFSGRPRRTAKR